MYLIFDGIHLNPIDSWIIVFLEHGAGWLSAFIALVVLIKSWKPVRGLYYDYMLRRIDTLEAKMDELSSKVIGSGKVYEEKCHDSFKLFENVRARKLKPMPDYRMKFRAKREEYITKMMDNI